MAIVCRRLARIRRAVVCLLFGATAISAAVAAGDADSRLTAAARDMGVFHVAYTLPQVFAPALLAPILYRLNQPGSIAGVATGHHAGYRAVFASAVLWFVLATVMVSRIRKVR